MNILCNIAANNVNNDDNDIECPANISVILRYDSALLYDLNRRFDEAQPIGRPQLTKESINRFKSKRPLKIV